MQYYNPLRPVRYTGIPSFCGQTHGIDFTLDEFKQKLASCIFGKTIRLLVEKIFSHALVGCTWMPGSHRAIGRGRRPVARVLLVVQYYISFLWWKTTSPLFLNFMRGRKSRVCGGKLVSNCLTLRPFFEKGQKSLIKKQFYRFSGRFGSALRLQRSEEKLMDRGSMVDGSVFAITERHSTTKEWGE